MIHLWNTFLGYIQISYPRIPWILLFACAFFILFALLQRNNDKKRICSKAVLSLCCSFIFVLTLFNRAQGDYGFSLVPFASYRTTLAENGVEILLQSLMNIATYIPLGFWLPCCFPYFEKSRRVLVAVLICSVSIELIQGFAKIGYMEIDDTLNNVAGAIIGLLLYRLFVKIKSKS